MTTQTLITNATITRNFSGVGPVSNARVSDIDLIDSYVLGGKVGYYLERKQWLGVEGEVFWSRPDIKQQAINVAAPNANGGNSFARTQMGERLNMTIASLSVLTRDSSMGRFQPYAGVGVALTYTGYDVWRSTFLTPGLIIQAGGRYFLDDHVAASENSNTSIPNSITREFQVTSQHNTFSSAFRTIFHNSNVRLLGSRMATPMFQLLP